MDDDDDNNVERCYTIRDESCILINGVCCCLSLQPSNNNSNNNNNLNEKFGDDYFDQTFEHKTDVEIHSNNNNDNVEEDDSLLCGWPRELDWDSEEYQLAEQLISAIDIGDCVKARNILEEYELKYGGGENVNKKESLVNVRVRNKENIFPLGLAASLDDIDMMELLVEYGACMRSQTDNNESALHLASMLGRYESVNFLLEKGLGVFLTVSNFNDENLIDQVLNEITYFNDELEKQEKEAQAIQQVAVALLKFGAMPALEIVQNTLHECTETLNEDLEELLLDLENNGSLLEMQINDVSPPPPNQVLLKKQSPPPQLNRLQINTNFSNKNALLTTSIASPPSSTSPRKRSSLSPRKRYIVNSHRILVKSPEKKMYPKYNDNKGSEETKSDMTLHSKQVDIDKNEKNINGELPKL